MPIYEYQCEGCQAVHEVVQKFSDAPMETCPQCGKKVKKLISRSSFHLKGTGWYNSDYKAKQNVPTVVAAKETNATDAAPAKSETSAPAAVTTEAVKPKAS